MNFKWPFITSLIINMAMIGLTTYEFSTINNSNEFNLTEFPFNHSCLMDNNNHILIGNSIYAHTCYNPWVHQTIVDLRFLKDGEVKINDLTKNILSDNI